MLFWKTKEIAAFMISLQKIVLAYRYIDRLVKQMWLNAGTWVKDNRELLVLFL